MLFVTELELTALTWIASSWQ